MPVFTSTSISLAKTCCPFSLMCGAHLIVFSSITNVLVSDVRDRSAAMQKMVFWTLPLELTSRWKLVFASTSISIAQTCCPPPPGVLCAFARILTDPNRSDQVCAQSFRSDAKDGILDAAAGSYFTLEAYVCIHFHVYSPNLLSLSPWCAVSICLHSYRSKPF